MEIITKNELLLHKKSFLSGLTASIIYFFTFIFAGFAETTYTFNSGTAGFESQLTGPTGLIIGILFLIYNIIMAFFGLVIITQFTKKNQRKMTITGFLFVLMGITSLLLIFFPLGRSNVPELSSVLALIRFLLTVVVIVVTGYATWEVLNTTTLLIVSMVVLALIILTLSIGYFLVWVAMISYVLYKTDKTDIEMNSLSI